MSSRKHSLSQWLTSHFSSDAISLVDLTGDAGFRQYFRFQVNGCSYIAVDSPPELINNRQFIEVQAFLANHQVQVPKIVAFDETSGFFCLSDFGDDLLANLLTLENVDNIYRNALDCLLTIAKLPVAEPGLLPIYDRAFVNTELTIFSQWFLGTHLQLTLSVDERRIIDQTFALLVDNAISQPQVVMHRDFHSRNLLQLVDNTLGVIDFQDAVIGPITYDAVSLLKDCYVKWPVTVVETMRESYRLALVEQGVLNQQSATEFTRWFDLMGAQRHLKAIGIFARLHHRDGKSAYLKDIPRTMSYLIDLRADYPELSDFVSFLNNRVLVQLAGRHQ